MSTSPDGETPAQWPERFIYVCSAGGSAVVNLAPMLHAGHRRVAGVVILVGLSNPNDPTPNDKAHALAPAARLKDYATKVIGLAERNVKLIERNGDLIGAWTDVPAIVSRIAHDAKASIVFNITGGRVASKLGFMLSLRPSAGPAVAMISIGLAGFVVRLVEPASGGAFIERPLPIEGRITMADYLRSYGVEEVNQKARLARERKYRESGGPLAEIGRLIGAGRARNALGELMAAIGPREEEVDMDLQWNTVRALQPLLETLPAVTVTGRRVSLTNTAAIKFLKGGWLEAMVLCAAEKALTGRDGLEIAAALNFRRSGLANGEESDLDLAVLGNDTLGLVECKAIVRTGKQLREGLNRLDSYRRHLMGHGGHAWLVAPLLTEQQVTRNGHMEQAKAQGIRLLHGSNAVETLAVEMQKAFR